MSERMLEGRVAVVTGAGRGIGRAEATRLAAYGARVVVNDVGVATDGAETGETPADEVVAAIADAGGEAIADAHDISTPEGGEALVQAALDTWGRVDIVVNNAGIGRPHMVFNLDGRRVGRRAARPSHRNVRGQPARVPLVARRAQGGTRRVRAPRQHLDGSAALRRRRAVELRRGEGGRRSRSPTRSRPRWRPTA